MRAMPTTTDINQVLLRAHLIRRNMIVIVNRADTPGPNEYWSTSPRKSAYLWLRHSAELHGMQYPDAFVRDNGDNTFTAYCAGQEPKTFMQPPLF